MEGFFDPLIPKILLFTRSRKPYRNHFTAMRRLEMTQIPALNRARHFSHPTQEQVPDLRMV
jgi:hypothetical protein